MGSIRWRILKPASSRYSPSASKYCYSGLDPMEDTETFHYEYRVMCENCGYSGLDPMEDTETYARPDGAARSPPSYSGLDPMEDTETAVQQITGVEVWLVTVGSIRWRILKR